MLYKKIQFNKFNDGNGDLIPIELTENSMIPFDVKRCYFISNPKNLERGNHAHIDLEQIIICCNGSFTLHLDNGLGNKEDLILDSNDIGIYIKGIKWRILKNFSKDCVILVLANKPHCKSKYIRNYELFLEIAKENKIQPF